VRTVAVINRKGGSGKTTTTVNLAAALGERGKRVLVIDLDPQASASDWLGNRRSGRQLFDALVGTRELTGLVVPTSVSGVDLVPSSPWLATAERTLLGDLSVAIARAIERLERRWAFVIVDCPPTLSYLAVGALAGVQEALIPVEAHAIALSGVAPVLSQIVRLRSDLNPRLNWVTIVPCRVSRTRHARTVVEGLEQEYGELVTRTRIRESVRVAEAWEARQPVIQFAPESSASADYRMLALELSEGPNSMHEDRVSASWWRALVPLAAANR
jgi:chromosome partitioning protein